MKAKKRTEDKIERAEHLESILNEMDETLNKYANNMTRETRHEYCNLIMDYQNEYKQLTGDFYTPDRAKE